MIRYLLLQNRAGKTRLAKYYIPLDDAEKHALEYEVHKLIANRDPKFTNFVEVSCRAAAVLRLTYRLTPWQQRMSVPRLQSAITVGALCAAYSVSNVPTDA